MKLLKSFWFYAGATAINAAIPFLLLPVLTQYLSPAEYGIMTVVQTIISFLFPLTVLGIGTSLFLEYYHLPREELPAYLSTIICVPLFMSLLNLAIFAIFGGMMADYFGVPRIWIFLIPLLVLLQIAPYLVGLLYQVRQEADKYAWFQISLAMATALLSIVLVVSWKMGWVGRMLGIYLTFGLFSIVAIYELFRMRYLVKYFRYKYIRQALIIGIPLIPHELGQAVINMSDRLFISKMVNVEAVGHYTIGYQLGMVIMMISSALSQAWSPYLFENLVNATEKTKAKLVKQSYLMMGLFLLALAGLYIATPLIFRLFIDKRFAGAIDYVFWVALGYVFYGMYTLVVNYIYFAKKTYILAWLTAGNAIVNILFNYIFILKFGAIGAAYATTLSFFLFFLLAWWLSNKVYPMPWFAFSRKI